MLSAGYLVVTGAQDDARDCYHNARFHGGDLRPAGARGRGLLPETEEKRSDSTDLTTAGGAPLPFALAACYTGGAG